MTRLLEEELRAVPDAAIRFALQSRVDAAISFGDTGRALALLEVFFDLERLEIDTSRQQAVARLGDVSHPVLALLPKPPAVREALLAKRLVERLRLGLTSVGGAKRAAWDFQRAGPLPSEDEQWVLWYSDGQAQTWFKRIAEQAEHGIGSGIIVGLIEAAAREIGHTVPLVCFPNLLAIIPAECLTPEKSYAAGRSALWSDFLQTRRSLQSSENALRQLNDDLEQRVRIRTAELEAAKARAEDSERAKDRFLANMSHEIRTPMHGVLGMLDLLSSSELTSEQAEQAAVMRRSGVALLDVVNGILDYSKIQTGGLTLESTEHSPAGIAADIVSLFQPLTGIKNIAMHLVVEGVPQRIMGDPTQMRQVLGNLVGNAVKFTERGSITLSLRGDEGRGRLRVEVADSGIGIPATAVQRIFAPFWQADNSTRRRFGGTGLGLSISSELVKAMGGQLAVDSTPGEGSTFYFEIPMKTVEQKAPVQAEPAPDTAEFPMFRVNLLLAEDNPVNQLLAETQLATLGCRVQIASNGGEAVHLFSESDYDIVLMDCHMPELDGYQATVAIRALERERGGRHVPIIAVTATVSESERELCRAAGMDDLLSKPYGVKEMAEMLQRWLQAVDGAGAPQPPRATVSGAAPMVTKKTTAAQSSGVSGLNPGKEIVAHLHGLGSSEFAAQVLEVFLRDASTMLGALREAIGRRDGEGTYRVAHTIQGSAAMVGAASVARSCAAIAAAARSGSFDRCEAVLRELIVTFDAINGSSPTK